MSVMNRISLEDVSAASHAIWSDNAIADKIAAETMEIISLASKRKSVFFNGKSLKCIIGGLFYLLGYKHDVIKRQRVLAEQLSTTEVTIRESYKDWLAAFPDIFEDTFSKLPARDKLRFISF